MNIEKKQSLVIQSSKFSKLKGCIIMYDDDSSDFDTILYDTGIISPGRGKKYRVYSGF